MVVNIYTIQSACYVSKSGRALPPMDTGVDGVGMGGVDLLGLKNSGVRRFGAKRGRSGCDFGGTRDCSTG